MSLSIAQPVPAKNGKAANLLKNGHAWIEKFTPGKSTPFRPSCFDEGSDASRVTCSINAEHDLGEWAQAADDQLVAAVCENSAYYMGKKMTEAEIRAAYCPLYREHEKYAASCKVKVNRQGSRATRFWKVDGSRTVEPDDWTMCTFAPRIWLKGLWITAGARQWGVSVELTDVQLTEISQDCPFETVAEDPFV